MKLKFSEVQGLNDVNEVMMMLTKGNPMKTGNTFIIYTIYTHLNILRIKHVVITIPSIKSEFFQKYKRKERNL